MLSRSRRGLPAIRGKSYAIDPPFMARHPAYFAPSFGVPQPDTAIPAASMDIANATSRENPAAIRRIGHTVNVSAMAIQPAQFLPWGTRYRLAIIRCLDRHANCCGKEIDKV